MDETFVAFRPIPSPGGIRRPASFQPRTEALQRTLRYGEAVGNNSGSPREEATPGDDAGVLPWSAAEREGLNPIREGVQSAQAPLTDDDAASGDSVNLGEFRLKTPLLHKSAFCEVYEGVVRPAAPAPGMAPISRALGPVAVGDRVIIKTLNPPHVADHEDRLAFKAEADALRNVSSNPIARVPRFINYFEANGEQYLVQEFIDGVHLRLPRRSASAECMKPYEVRRFLDQMLKTLREVHRLGYIHNDIRPSNIMSRNPDGSATAGPYVLIDFGNSQRVGAAGRYRRMPQAQEAIVGNSLPDYFAPERTSAGLCYYCSDIYALGIIAIQLLSGAIIGELQWNRQGHIVTPEYPYGNDPILERVLINMTCYFPWQRYQDADEVLRALAQEKPTVILPIPEEPAYHWRTILHAVILVALIIASTYAWRIALAWMCKESVGCSP